MEPLALDRYIGHRRNKMSLTNTLAYYGTELITSVKSFHGKDSGGVCVMMDGVRFNDLISNEITSNDAKSLDSITIDLVPKLQM